MALQDGVLARRVDGVRQGATFVRRRVEPARDVAPGASRAWPSETGNASQMPRTSSDSRNRRARRGYRMGNCQTAARLIGWQASVRFAASPPSRSLGIPDSANASCGAWRVGELARRADVTKLQRRAPSACPLTTCHQGRAWLKPGGHDQRTPLLAVWTDCLPVAPSIRRHAQLRDKQSLSERLSVGPQLQGLVRSHRTNRRNERAST